MFDLFKHDRYTFIVKITGTCNLRCSYCYHFANMENSQKFFHTDIMSDEILEQTIKKLIEMNSRTVNFIWHGGEPLLVGIEKFKKIIEYQNKYKGNKLISNSVQSNGTLINDEWAKFFAENKFQVGISVDGPKELHTKNRTNGKDNNDFLFQQIINSFNLLIKHKVSFGVLTVVTKHSLNYIKEMFDFYINNGIKGVGFIPAATLDDTGKIDKELSILPKDYAQFIISFFDIWSQSKEVNLKIREFDECIRGLLNVKHRLCRFSDGCKKHFTVYPDGSLYLCDNFPMTDNFRVGTVYSEMRDIVESDNYKSFLEKIKKVPEGCNKCKYFKVCRGDCKHSRFIVSRDFKQQGYFCPANKMIYSHIAKAVKSL